MATPVTLTHPDNVAVSTTRPLPVTGAVGGTPVSVTETNSAAMLTAIGTPADAVWSGTGPGTVIAILKAIAVNTSTT